MDRRMREEMAANHQTISITVSGLAELAHSEYQVGEGACFKDMGVSGFECWMDNISFVTGSSQAGDYENAEKHSMQLWRQVKRLSEYLNLPCLYISPAPILHPI